MFFGGGGIPFVHMGGIPMGGASFGGMGGMGGGDDDKPVSTYWNFLF